jgi:hypothetical protein
MTMATTRRLTIAEFAEKVGAPYVTARFWTMKVCPHLGGKRIATEHENRNGRATPTIDDSLVRPIRAALKAVAALRSDKDRVSMNAAAKKLGCSIWQIKSLIKSGTLASKKCGGSHLVSLKEARSALFARRSPPPIPQGWISEDQAVMTYPFLTRPKLRSARRPDEKHRLTRGDRKRKLGCPLLGGRFVRHQNWLIRKRGITRWRPIYAVADLDAIAAALAADLGQVTEDGVQYRTIRRLASEHGIPWMTIDNWTTGRTRCLGLSQGERLSAIVRRVPCFTEDNRILLTRQRLLSVHQFDQMMSRLRNLERAIDLPRGRHLTWAAIWKKYRVPYSTFRYRWRNAARILGEEPISIEVQLPRPTRGGWHVMSERVYLDAHADVVASKWQNGRWPSKNRLSATEKRTPADARTFADPNVLEESAGVCETAPPGSNPSANRTRRSRDGRLIVRLDPPDATFSGEHFPLPPDQALFLCELLDREGEITTTSIARPERMRDRLPAVLRALIDATRGRGMRIRI